MWNIAALCFYVLLKQLLADTERMKMSGDFVCVEVLWPNQPNGVMSSVVSLPNHTFAGQA